MHHHHSSIPPDPTTSPNNRVRHQIMQEHLPDICGDVDTCDVPGHAFYLVRFKPDVSQGRVRWLDLPLDLREDLRCDSVSVLHGDRWCIVGDE